MSRVHIARAAAVFLTVGLVVQPVGLKAALAIPQPTVDETAVPIDGPPGPEQPMRQGNVCAEPIAAPQPDITLPAPGFTMLNIAAAWEHSTGNGILVAVIDTGVTPNGRLAVKPGGDYISGGDGLTDCDAHGTIVASIIAAAPLGAAMPKPMPPTPNTLGPKGPIPINRPNADGFAGVAPHATILSIRQSSRAYEPQNPDLHDPESRHKAGTVRTLARAIVHAANLGAKVINVSVAACIEASDPLDQRAMGAAVWFAAMVKDALIVTAAGNEGDEGCRQNPVIGVSSGVDPRDWIGVRTVSLPSVYADYLLSVGAVDSSGSPVVKSLAGPWVGVGAPGTGIVGLSPRNGLPVNAYPPPRLGEGSTAIWGTSFAAAYASGVAALIRAKYPQLTARQVIQRIEQTAHRPARGVDNRIGYGVVDPIAALTYDVPPAGLLDRIPQTKVVQPLAVPVLDHRPQQFALVFTGAVMVGILAVAAVTRIRRAR